MVASFFEHTGVITKKYAGEVTEQISFDWIVETVEEKGSMNVKLTTNPSMHELQIHSFCDRFMFVDGRPHDGHLYLYQKR